MVAKFKLRQMNKAERARLAHINELNDEEPTAKIVGKEGDIIKVLSFTDPEESTIYDVWINVGDDFLESCTCLDQQTNNSPCKHMNLLSRVFNTSLIHPQPSSSSSFFSSSLRPPPLPSSSSYSPSLSQQKLPRVDIMNTGSQTAGDLSQEALDRFVDSFELLKSQAEKSADKKLVPVAILNRLATQFQDATNELKRWNSSSAESSRHQLRF